MIERDEILKGQMCPPELEENLSNLLVALNQFRSIYGKPMIVTSGYRTSDHNASISGSKNSAHCLCMAADFSDQQRLLTEYILANIFPRVPHEDDILVRCGLYMEHPGYTPTWCHLQTRQIPSGNRVFIP